MEGRRVSQHCAWAAALAICAAGTAAAQTDPGVRPGANGAGFAISGLSTNEQAFFDAGRDDFAEEEGIGDGLGPRFNLDSCGGCHSQPDMGGTSPAVNPQFDIATAFGAHNAVPPFITRNGPVREARFKTLPNGAPDGGVHALYVISQRIDSTGSAASCNILQDNFAQQQANGNVIFRIPTPVFGLGLLEEITDQTLILNLNANAGAKAARGITGRFNHNGNDGRISRFGWKAQNPTGLVFSGEAYNVEMGITNEAFQTERDETPECQFATLPNDTSNPDGATGIDTISAIEKFAFFMRFLDQPTPSTTVPGGANSIIQGRNNFVNIGCALCHTPSLTTGNATVLALRNKQANLFSDLALHNMGPGLADDIVQGEARGDEFRTAPLWGLGKRIFFLHDGRTTNLLTAIQAHASNGNARYPASEANSVVNAFNALTVQQKQDLLNFLRSL
ncbi:MAG TPA: di-heme oxidoredictase family protein [Steroidobacteraceae bacterium]|nr:di-heme oxidoredictase family protein [Steroidobacteraceae bacterium]